MDDAPGAPDDRAACAGFWRRFAAYAIDYVVVLFGSAMLGIAAAIAGIAAERTESGLTLTVLAAYFLYCTLLESSAWQATVGKRALGLKVTNRYGERIGFVRAGTRFAVKALSVLTLGIGYLLIAVTQRRQALHDLVAGTLVTYDATPRRSAWLVAAISTLACAPIVGVLGAIVIPAYRDYSIRSQVSEGLALADGHRAAIEAAWRNAPRNFTDLTSDGLAAGLPRAGRFVESIEIVSGMIVITYGGESSSAIAGNVLTLVPAVDAHGSLAWACGYGQAPSGFEIVFEGHSGYSDIAENHLPSACRSSPP